MNRQKHAGFTLIETMIVVAIIGIVVAIAAPSFSVMLEKQRIQGAAEAVLGDLRWARAESIKRNKKVRVTFTTGNNWSYTIDTFPILSASDGVLPKIVYGSDFASTSLTTNFTSEITTFEAVRGTTNAGRVTITTTNFNAGVVVSKLGRVRICGSMGGYDAC
ncbi:MAG: GspH/FimT family pseudopilin [Methylobacter sp.]|nr:GspH/FimT family pseudopilin [Methylobacter sp.]